MRNGGHEKNTYSPTPGQDPKIRKIQIGQSSCFLFVCSFFCVFGGGGWKFLHPEVLHSGAQAATRSTTLALVSQRCSMKWVQLIVAFCQWLSCIPCGNGQPQQWHGSTATATAASRSHPQMAIWGAGRRWRKKSCVLLRFLS